MHVTDETALAGMAPGNDTTENGAVDVAALTRALDAGQVDVAVHCLQLLLFKTDQQKTVNKPRVRRLKTLQSAVTQMLSDYDNHKEEEGLLLRPGLASSSVNASCELSYAQLQMFALQRMQPSSTAYNVVRALQFSDMELNLSALESTCDALMAKHEALRTCFDVDMNAGGEPRQVVHPLSHFRGHLEVLLVVQTELLLAGNGEASRDSELSVLVARTTNEPFDLACQAPIRVYVFTSPDTSSTSQWILAVVLHHIVTDAASSQIFWNDFHELYSRFSRDGETNATSAEFVQQLVLEASCTLRLTYCDFAVWQRSRMRSGTTAPLLQYWIQQLTEGGAPPILELPFDFEIDNRLSEKPAVPESTTIKGDVVVFRSSPALQRAFSELCHAQGASLFMGLLAVFYLLIERLTGQQDFVIGAPSSGRDSAELQDVMGYFVNTLPLRLRVKGSGNEDFKCFLASVREVVIGAYNHMDIPFHKVLEHLRASAHNTDGDSERRWQHPLLQIMFSWEQSNQGSSTDKYSELVLPHHSAKFDLMLSMRYRRLGRTTNDRVLEGSMEYPTARFSRATVKRFTNYFLELLEQVTRTPTTPVRSPSISMLSDSERKQLVSKWGMPKLPTSSIVNDRPSSKYLDECLFLQVQNTPQSPALHFEGTEWTYQDLWDHSGRVMNALSMLDIPGCAAELHIGLLLDRGLENVAVMVATLRHKAVFVPLDPEFPRERLRYMARDSGLQVIITQRKHATIATYLSVSLTRDTEDEDELSPCVLCYEDVDLLTSHRGGFAKDSDRSGRRESRDSHRTAAYILYTSGSTGNPKGVVVPHAALMTTLWWTVRTYKVAASDVFLQSTSTTLDGSLSQLFSPLLVGGSARITRPKGLHELHYMRNVLLGAPRITFCVFVPSYFALIVDYLSDRGDAFPASVKHVVLAGEAFPIELARQFYRKNTESPTCLVNEYGPTEASITSTAFKLPRELALQSDSSFSQSVPIGKPIDDHPVVVLDARKRLVPVNVPGELYIGGAGVAQGYWHRPDLTENAFILHEDLEELASLAQKRGRRWYKTGDLVKWLPSGDLVFLGRTDAQVKHHGMRIELQEVRNVLLRYTGVKAAEVLAIPQVKAASKKRRQTSSMLVAFVMLVDGVSDRSNGDEFLDKLWAYLGDHLPMHMIPQSIQVVSCWPRTPNGKIDLRALATWAGVDSSTRLSNAEEPQRAVNDECTITVQLATDILRQVWAQALGLDDLDDLEDDEEAASDQQEERLMSKSFFELGGDSLAAIRAIALAQARGLPLPLEQFFRTSSLPEMAKGAAASMANLREWTSDMLVPLNWPTTKSSRKRPTLFVFHDADGTAWKLLELARQLPFAVVGVQATTFKGDESSQVEATSVQELAKRYWDIIRGRQSEGPYGFGGFSFGCRVAFEVARLAVHEGHALLPLVLLDGLPFEMLSTQQRLTKAEKEAVRLRIEQYASEAFGDPLLQPLGVNYSKFCAMEEVYQPYTIAEVEAAFSSPDPPTWLHADLYMTQRWNADVSQYRSLGIAITTVTTLPDCSHLTMLRHPTVEHIARQIRQRALKHI